MESVGKVLIIVENLPIPFDRRVWMEATTLKNAGYEVSVISPKGKGFESDYELIEGIHVYRHPMPPDESSVKGYFREYFCALRWEFKLARKIWRERRFDVVHICNPPDLLFLVAGWFKLLKGVKVIFDQHDINPELYETKYGRRDLFYKALCLAERVTFSIADIVISTNESYKEIALTRGGKSPEQVFIVRSGPDLSKFSPVTPNPAYGMGKKYMVGYVGVMGEQEGIDYLLKSIKYIVKEKHRQDIHFMLIGGGPVVEQLKELTKEFGIQSFVEFTGRISDEELLARLSSCHVCVNPDKKTPFNDRSTMNKVLEYMALGKPVVQFDLLEGRRSAAEASLYAKPNDYIDFAEKIIELIENADRSIMMGEVGRRRMEYELEWRYQVPKLLNAYKITMNKNK